MRMRDSESEPMARALAGAASALVPTAAAKKVASKKEKDALPASSPSAAMSDVALPEKLAAQEAAKQNGAGGEGDGVGVTEKLRGAADGDGGSEDVELTVEFTTGDGSDAADAAADADAVDVNS